MTSIAVFFNLLSSFHMTKITENIFSFIQNNFLDLPKSAKYNITSIHISSAHHPLVLTVCQFKIFNKKNIDN